MWSRVEGGGVEEGDDAGVERGCFGRLVHHRLAVLQSGMIQKDLKAFYGF